MAILYTVTAYPPSTGGAQLHLREFARQIATGEPVGVAYQWDKNRTDWLFGTTLRAPSPATLPPDGAIQLRRIAPSENDRRKLRAWVWLYPLVQGASIQHIAGALLPSLREAADMLPERPRLIHNSRIGREGLTAASLMLAREMSVPFVLTPNHHGHWRGWFYRHYLNIYRQADAVIAYTANERNTLIRLGVDSSRVHVLGVGAILAEQADGIAFRARYNLPDDVPVVLFLGQKYRYKGYRMLLEAAPMIWRQHPQARLLFIGPRTDASRRDFARVDDPRILELDTVSLQAKTDALAACDLLCVPSRRESFGGVYLEAWGLGKPVVAGSSPAVRELLTASSAGVGATSTREVATAVSDLLSDPDRRATLGAAGKTFSARYRWGALADQLRAVYDQLT